MPERTRTDLNRAEKIGLLDRYRSLPTNTSQRESAESLGISRGLLRNLLRDEEKLRTTTEQSNDRKRQRHGKNDKVEDSLWEWFQFARSRRVPINGPILCQKAEDLARLLGFNDFEATDGWLHRWKQRHSLCYAKLHGEAGDADTEAAALWRQQQVRDLLESYGPEEIYNADETAFYYRALPDSTYVEKELLKQSRGNKVAKDRLTVLVCCSMAGCKEKPLVIGKSKTPRCFKNVQSYPTDYAASSNAWMTTSIWTRWLQKWDRRLCASGRKVALLVDNCTAHGEVQGLTSIRIIKFAPNTTSIIQPCDMGVIRTLKAYCRHAIRGRIIDEIEDSDANVTAAAIARKLSVLDALHIVAAAWTKVTEETIRNCWEKANFLRIDENQSEHVPPELNLEVPDGMESELFHMWVNIDAGVPVACELSFEEEESAVMAEIVEEFREGHAASPNEDEEEVEEEEPTPSNADIRSCLRLIRVALERNGFPDVAKFDYLSLKIRDFIRKSAAHQTTLPEFFHRIN